MRAPFLEFSRFSKWDIDGVRCDCAGLINLLYQRLNGGSFSRKKMKASDFFDYFKEQGAHQNIHDLKRHDVIVWRKRNPPQNGDSGHIMLALKRPIRITDERYLLQILEVNKFDGLVKRDIEMITHKDGHMVGVAWHPREKKIKHTEILSYSFFKQQKCQRCNLFQKDCFCGDFPTPRKPAPHFVILRHPNEALHDLGTVNLLQNYYEDLRVLDGHNFAAMEGILIYPQTEQEPVEMITSLENNQLPLIFIDATWKKSYRLLQENPWLKKLKRYSLEGASSNYQIRKVPSEDSLSTLEAFALCLEKTGNKEEAQQLQGLFSTFIEKKKSYRPSFQDL